jgi:arginase
MTDPITLRLLWPQWQGASADNIDALLPEFPHEEARLGYTIGTDVLQAVLPPHHGPTDTVPVTFGDEGLDSVDGVDAKGAVLRQLGAALEVIGRHDADRIVTLGGECSVSVAPFTALADRYGDDVAVVWIDSHPDVGTPASEYHGYHAMAVSAITGHGDRDVLELLPAVVDPSRVALAGLHSWTEDDFPNAAAWGITTFWPDDLRTDSDALLAWLRSTGCSKVAIHLDVDTVDGDEVVLGLGAESGGLTTTQVRRLVDDLGSTADVVGVTVAEYIPRQVMAVRGLLSGFPLL